MGRSNLVRCSEVTAVYTATGKVTGYRIELWHTGLNEHRLLRAPDRSVLQNKVNSQFDQWEEKWARVSAKQHALFSKKKGSEIQQHA